MRESQRRAGQLEDELGSASPPCADAPPWAARLAAPHRLAARPRYVCPVALGGGQEAPRAPLNPLRSIPCPNSLPTGPCLQGTVAGQDASVRGSVGDRCPARALGHTLSATWFLIQAPLRRALPDAPREPRSPGHAGTVNLRRQASAHFQTGHLGTDWPVATECSQVPGQ